MRLGVWPAVVATLATVWGGAWKAGQRAVATGRDGDTVRTAVRNTSRCRARRVVAGLCNSMSRQRILLPP